MGNCSSNTLFIGRPGRDGSFDTKNCQTNCLGVFDPIVCGKIGPRRNREKVREQIKDACLMNLGAPVVKVELDQQQLDYAVDRALNLIEDYAGREYFDYYVFNTTSGKSVYTMPPDVGLIRNVYYKKQPSVSFGVQDLGGALPIEYYNGNYGNGGVMNPTTPIYGNMGSWTLYKQYEQMYNRLSSQIGGWEWIGGFCNIKLYPTPCGCHSVIVQYLQKRPDFGQITEAMIEGATCFCKQILGRIRSKYRRLPGPQGGTELDGVDLLREGTEELKQWKEDLIYRYGDIFGPVMD